MQIPTGFKRVPDTNHYALCEETGLVMNLKTGRALTPSYIGGAIRTAVVDKNGKSFKFRHDAIDDEKLPELSVDYVLHTEKARVIPSNTRYAITVYGLVYCIEPHERGPNAGRIHVVTTVDHQGHECVRLRGYDKRQVFARVDKLLHEVWGDLSNIGP